MDIASVYTYFVHTSFHTQQLIRSMRFWDSMSLVVKHAKWQIGNREFGAVVRLVITNGASKAQCEKA